MAGYLLCFILQPFPAYLGVLKNVSFDVSLMWEFIFFSMNSMIFAIHDLKVTFVPPLPLSLLPFSPPFYSDKDTILGVNSRRVPWPLPSWLHPGYEDDLLALENSKFRVQSASSLSFPVSSLNIWNPSKNQNEFRSHMHTSLFSDEEPVKNLNRNIAETRCILNTFIFSMNIYIVFS